MLPAGTGAGITGVDAAALPRALTIGARLRGSLDHDVALAAANRAGDVAARR